LRYKQEEKMKLTLLILIFAALAPKAWADADYQPASPSQGVLSIPHLSLAGQAAFQTVRLGVDIAHNRILSLEVGAPLTGAANVQGDYVPLDANSGILSLPVLLMQQAPLYKAVKIHLDFAHSRFTILDFKPARPLMLGAYTGKFTGTAAVVEAEFKQMDRWAGKPLSLGGMFIDLEADNPAYIIPTALDTLRQNHYTAFINLASWRSAEDILSGKIDTALQQLGQAFGTWLNADPSRWVWLAPLPEMNGTWETYTTDPETFKRAFAYIQDSFRAAGVTQGVGWVFAPNGWSWPERNFEFFYPGDARIDAVGFSGYNRGYCTSFAYPRWESPAEVFGEYLQRMRTMAPSKPIIITQMASSSDIAPGEKSEAAKDTWLREAYAYLARSEGVAGLMYFNIDKECDWAYHRPDGGMKSAGYLDAARDPLYGYTAMDAMRAW
jgi:hypothetical protein